MEERNPDELPVAMKVRCADCSQVYLRVVSNMSYFQLPRDRAMFPECPTCLSGNWEYMIKFKSNDHSTVIGCTGGE